jgi:hypothetical protein
MILDCSRKVGYTEVDLGGQRARDGVLGNSLFSIMFKNPYNLEPSNSLKSCKEIRGTSVFDIHRFLNAGGLTTLILNDDADAVFCADNHTNAILIASSTF